MAFRSLCDLTIPNSLALSWALAPSVATLQCQGLHEIPPLGLASRNVRGILGEGGQHQVVGWGTKEGQAIQGNFWNPGRVSVLSLVPSPAPCPHFWSECQQQVIATSLRRLQEVEGVGIPGLGDTGKTQRPQQTRWRAGLEGAGMSPT
jgi:hypothetical protein